MPAVLFAMAALLPHLDSAFTIDDVTFLLQARHVLEDPLHPSAFDLVADGVFMRLSSGMVSGPVMAYLLVPSVIAGGAEWIAHLVQAIVLALGLVATASLALRLGLGRVQAALAALLVVSSPGVLGMAATAMPDVEAMAFGVAAVDRLLAWRDTRRWSSAILSAVLFALAALSRPHACLVVIPAAILLIPDGGWTGGLRSVVARGWRDGVPIVLGGVIAVAADFATRDPSSGTTAAAASFARVEGRHLWENLVSIPVQWTLSFPLAIGWSLFAARRMLRSPVAWAGFAAGVILGTLGHPHSFTWRTPGLLAIAGLGGAVLVDVLVDGWRRRDWMQVSLGSWLLIAAVAAPYAHLPAKYLAPSAPAMAILLVRAAGSCARRRAPQFALGALVAVGGTVALLVVDAGVELAQVGRVGGEIAAAEVARGRRVWTDGGGGLQWYGTLAGAPAVAENLPPPAAGDVVVCVPPARAFRATCPKATLLSRRVFDEPGGRVMSFKLRAGFYSNGVGPLPWVWGDDELGRVEVWRVDE